MKKRPFRFTLFLLICLSLLLIATAQAVDIPDPNLRAAVEAALGKASGDPITAGEMAVLTFFEAESAGIRTLTGLEYATSLLYLFLWDNSISDLSPLSDLTNLQFLDLQGNSVSDLSPAMDLTNLIFLGLRNNSVSDLSPLVANTGLGTGNSVNVEGNPLSDASINTHIPALQSRGVEVLFGSPPAGVLPIDETPEIEDRTPIIDPDEPRPTTLVKISGDRQSGLPGETLPDPFIVEVRDQYNISMEGVPVSFIIVTGGGSLSTRTTTTDANGRAESTLTLGNTSGTLTIEAYAEDISQGVVFTVDGYTPIATTLVKISGDDLYGSPGETLPDPFIVEVQDQYNIPMEGVLGSFSVVTGGGSLSTTTIITDANGRAESTLTLGNQPGTNIVEVNAAGIFPIMVFSVEGYIRTATTLETVSGDSQSGVTGDTLMNPFVVQVRDQRSHPLEGTTVQFTLLTGGGSLSTTTAITDANGRAESTLTLGNEPGTNTIQVSVEGVSQTVIFTAEAIAPIPTMLETVSGNNQSGLTGDSLTNPFVVQVLAQNGNPLRGAAVQFTLLTGGGALRPTTSITDANGRAESTLTLGSNAGTNTVQVRVEGVSQTVTFTAEAIARIPTRLVRISGDNQNGVAGEALMNPFVVEVHNQYDDPMEGVMVTFAVSGAGGVLSPTTTITDANGLAESILVLGINSGINTVTVSVEGITEIVTFNAVAKLLEFNLSVPSGISLIHVPLKVRAVDGVAQTIESVGALYDALGGAETVNFLITYEPKAKQWRSYLRDTNRGTVVDKILTGDTGIIAIMKTPVSVRLGGNALSADGMSTITLHQGVNLVGLPLRDSRVARVSDLFTLEGIGGNVPVVILTDNGEFKAVARPGDSGDIPVTGGGAFFLIAMEATTVAISGEAWTNVSGTAAAPPIAITGIKGGDVTPVLALTGSIVDEGMGVNQVGIRANLKNLSTGREAAAVIADDGAGYQLTIVDIETGQAAQIGDILEISAISPDASIGVQPLRYTVTVEDVKRSRIQLPALVLQEIPAETELLRNYPNSFNPETWIPYRLAEDAVVRLTIYDGSGQVVRKLNVGHQVAAVYESRSKAIYWDGRNEVGERVASSVYFYHLSAGDYSATQKMLIVK